MRNYVGVQSPHHIQYVPDIVSFSYQFDDKDKFGIPPFSCTVGRRKISFFSNGHIVIHTSNKDRALDIANVVRFSHLLLYNRRDVPFESYQIDELFRVKITSTGDLEYDILDPAAFPLETTDWNQMNSLIGSHHRVSASKLEIICRLANDMYNSKMREQILLFFGCYSARQHDSHNLSFLQAWICIELTLRLLCKEINGGYKHYNWNDRNGRDQADELRNMSSYNMIDFLSYKLNMGFSLETYGLLPFPKDYLKKIDKVRTERNDIFHGKRRASKRDAKIAFSLANHAIWQIMRLGGINYRARLKEAENAPAVRYVP